MEKNKKEKKEEQEENDGTGNRKEKTHRSLARIAHSLQAPNPYNLNLAPPLGRLKH